MMFGSIKDMGQVMGKSNELQIPDVEIEEVFRTLGIYQQQDRDHLAALAKTGQGSLDLKPPVDTNLRADMYLKGARHG